MIRQFLLLMFVAGTSACGSSDRSTAGHDHDEHAGPDAEESQRGSHGGRLLVDGDLGVELAIYETGVQPEYRAWITRGGATVDPQQVQLTVELTRLGGVTDRIAFAPAGGFLRGDQTVYEPHSFDVKVTAVHAGQVHSWSYASYEGRVTIPAEVAQQAGIRTAVAGPGVIEERLTLYGTVGPDVTRVREVKARFPGVIRSVSRRIGDVVRSGEVLATVESNESLQSYPVTAPIAGVVTQRHAETGEQADGEALFEIADFSRVWAEFSVFARDRGRLRVGQDVHVTAEGGASARGRIEYISPLSSRETQSVTARVVLENSQQLWTPGQFVEGRVIVGSTPVDLSVPLSALQSFRDFTVVFATVDDTYEVRMLELGRRDADKVEVLDGLAPGTRIVTEQSYLIKADIEKSGASHDH